MRSQCRFMSFQCGNWYIKNNKITLIQVRFSYLFSDSPNAVINLAREILMMMRQIQSPATKIETI